MTVSDLIQVKNILTVDPSGITSLDGLLVKITSLCFAVKRERSHCSGPSEVTTHTRYVFEWMRGRENG